MPVSRLQFLLRHYSDFRIPVTQRWWTINASLSSIGIYFSTSLYPMIIMRWATSLLRYTMSHWTASTLETQCVVSQFIWCQPVAVQSIAIVSMTSKTTRCRPKVTGESSEMCVEPNHQSKVMWGGDIFLMDLRLAVMRVAGKKREWLTAVNFSNGLETHVHGVIMIASGQLVAIWVQDNVKQQETISNGDGQRKKSGKCVCVHKVAC